ncbi:hypothetical protein DFH29DRAFT_872312 [Suillus ampliporus]|nr:hypothetical protein DFH29DRAFT_872312 [Suillus ampliporus]
MCLESIKTIETLAAHKIIQQPEVGPSWCVVEATAAHNHPFGLSELCPSLSLQQPESAPDMDVDGFDIGESWNDLPDVESMVPGVERIIGETSGVSASGDLAPDPQLTTLPADDDFADNLCSVISKELPAALDTDVDINFIPDNGQDDLMSLDGGHETVEICATEPSNGIDDNSSQAPVVPTHTHNPQMHLEDAITPDEKVARLLNTIFNHLNIKDNFDIHPVCLVCHRVYPHDSQEIEEELDAWRCHVPEPGKHTLIQDGEIWKTIKGNDGKLFFNNSPECPDKGELCIGIMLGFDGFGYQHSRNAGTHSLGILSNCIANLPTHLRYQPQNMMVFGITPGPKEFDSDELQFFMKNYNHGQDAKLSKQPPSSYDPGRCLLRPPYAL